MSRMMNPLASSPISVVSSACSFVWGTLLVGRLIPTLWRACSAPLSLPRPAPTLALLIYELGQGPALLCVFQPCGCSPQVGAHLTFAPPALPLRWWRGSPLHLALVCAMHAGQGHTLPLGGVCKHVGLLLSG